MIYRLSVFLFGALFLSAQSPNLTGVWQADVAKSKFAGRPATNYLMIIEQQGSTLKETTGLTSRRASTARQWLTTRQAKRARTCTAVF